MYKISVRHYGEATQTMEPTFKRREQAERFMRQQAEIIKGYEKRTGFIDGRFIVFGDEDIFKTCMWVSK